MIETAVRRRAVAVALFAALLFAVVVENDFVLDDASLIEENPYLRSLSNIPRFFSSDYWEPRLRSGLYRPLVTTSYALNHVVGGLDPYGYHVVNILLHAAISALVLLVLHRLTGRLALATAAAFLFAAHAVHAEVIANVASGRPELLAALFTLLALRAYVGSPARRLSGASLGWFGLALLCKESAITFLAVLPLVDVVYGPTRPHTWRGAVGLLRERAPTHAAYLGVAIAYVGLRWLALDVAESLPAQRDLDNPLLLLPVGWRALNALYVALLYAGLLAWPGNLSYDYSFDQIPLIEGFADPRLYGVLLVAGLVAAGLFVFARRRPAARFGIGFGLVTFAVVSNAIVPIGTILAERLLYLPSIGFCLLLATVLHALAQRAGPRRARQVFAIASALIVALHGARGVARSLDWRTENGLYLHDLSVSPRSAKVQSNAGAALAELGRHDEALERYATAVEIAPGFAAPYRGRVLSLLALGRFEDARGAYPATLRFGPPVPTIEAAIRDGIARGRSR